MYPTGRRTPQPGDYVTLREITAGNRAEVEALHVAPGQEHFVGGVAASLTEAVTAKHAKPWYRAICSGGTPVGFVMLADDVPPDNTYIPYRYYLWRLLIDERYQRRGYGSAAMDTLVGYVETRPGADVLVTSVVLGYGSPMNFYLRYGFQRNGEMFHNEELLRLPLRG